MKNVLISGGTGGIGTFISIKLIEKGYFVVSTHNNKTLSFLNQWKKDHNIGNDQIKFINCNLVDYKETEASINKLIEEMPIDVLINNAGITMDSSFLKMDFDQWFEVINTNLIGLFSFTQAVSRQMSIRGSGNIINISSVNALKGQFGQTNYSSSKAGIIGFTKSLALELAAKGVRVNAICPGYTNTSMISKVPYNILEQIKNSIPTGQLVNPSEIANTVLYIIQDMPSLTGEILSVNGGQHMN